MRTVEEKIKMWYNIFMKYSSILEHKGLVWMNVTRQSEKELQGVKKKFDLLQQDIEECKPHFQRPKLVKRDHYYFIVLHFPVFDRKTRRLGFTEVDFFLSQNYVVTIHDNSIESLGVFLEMCSKEAGRKHVFKGTAAHLFLELLRHICDSIFPSLQHINEDINVVDANLFAQKIPNEKMAKEVLRLKTNIVNFRRAMQGHRTVLERLVLYGGRELDLFSYQAGINSLKEEINEIWHMLDNQKDSINALHETNESLINLRTNEVMRTLTVISVVTFPLTLMAALFAIAAPDNPFVHNKNGFLLIVTVLLWVAVFMIFFFKKRKWI